MPFVPIGSRKAHTLLLDHDKDRIRAQMQSKDEVGTLGTLGSPQQPWIISWGSHFVSKSLEWIEGKLKPVNSVKECKIDVKDLFSTSKTSTVNQ